MPTLTIEDVGTFEVPAGKRLVLGLTDEAEKAVLAAKGLTGVRLSCQVTCEHDMAVKIISRFAGSGRAGPGNRPTDAIAPPPVWVS